MVKLKRGFFKSLFICTNLVVILAYLVTCLIPFINTGKYWMLAFPGLVFPLVLAALAGFVILWIFFRSRLAWLNLAVLLLGYQQITTVFAFNTKQPFDSYKNPGSLRVMQWNASNWDEQKARNREATAYTKKMFELIKNENPDVLCVEEYFDSYSADDYTPNAKTLESFGFRHHYFVPTVSYTDDFKSGIAIFSKFPIIDSANHPFGGGRVTEHVIYTDIKAGRDTFRIFATHLQSVQFMPEDYRSLSRIKHAEKPSLHGSKTIVSKLKRGYQLRYEQAMIVSEQLRASPYPAIICGDFNDVPNSSTYFKIKGDFQDAFLQKGRGIGRTFLYISPTLRIDYILTSKAFEVEQFAIRHVPYSVHYPLITDLFYRPG